MGKTIKVKTKKREVTLTDKNYMAAGGQGAVFRLKDLAYKIYHENLPVIPEAKILELAQLKHDNILAPIEPLYDCVTNKAVGFTMPYINKVEFLCQLFTRNFRDAKGISPNEIADLVAQKQKTLQYIHNKGVLVVDYNEMNFLLDKDIRDVFFIDVDNYQTKNFPTTAIMDSIRDRKGKPGVFTELTDWFSWAIVTFQMYVGIHPYKGRIDGYKPKDWLKRMDDGVSVFEKGVRLPPACQDFSVIPPKHLAWYKEVFKHNQRSIPPLPDGVALASGIVRTVVSKGDFVVNQIFDVNEPIKNVFVFNGKRYALTRKGVYDEGKNLIVQKKNILGMCDVFGEDPLYVLQNNRNAEFYDLKNDLVGSIEAEDMMGYNGAIYTINNGQLVQNTFERLGKTIHRTKNVCDISRSYKVFRGVIFQDDFMKCRLAIPFDLDYCVNIRVKELDGQRIVDARYESGICIIISEQKGKYFKNTVCFNKDHSDYTILSEALVDFHAVNFTVLPNGMCLAVDSEKLSLFKGLSGRKEINDIPFDVSMRLYHHNMDVLFVDENKLYKVSMK